MLMNKKHPNGIALMGDENMQPHVGHKVKVKGMMENGNMQSQDNMGMMSMNVTSMKMISDHCDMGGAMSQ